MMKAVLLSLGIAASFIITPPARAENYPFCFKNDAGAGDCKYVSYEQCLAALSGRDGYCQRDPYFEQRRR